MFSVIKNRGVVDPRDSIPGRTHGDPDFARSVTLSSGPGASFDRRVDFPLEMKPVDYLRQIYFNIGAVLLVVHQHVMLRSRDGVGADFK